MATLAIAKSLNSFSGSAPSRLLTTPSGSHLKAPSLDSKNFLYASASMGPASSRSWFRSCTDVTLTFWPMGSLSGGAIRCVNTTSPSLKNLPMRPSLRVSATAVLSRRSSHSWAWAAASSWEWAESRPESSRPARPAAAAGSRRPQSRSQAHRWGAGSWPAPRASLQAGAHGVDDSRTRTHTHAPTLSYPMEHSKISVAPSPILAMPFTTRPRHAAPQARAGTRDARAPTPPPPSSPPQRPPR